MKVEHGKIEGEKLERFIKDVRKGQSRIMLRDLYRLNDSEINSLCKKHSLPVPEEISGEYVKGMRGNLAYSREMNWFFVGR